MKGRFILYSDEELAWLSDNRTMPISEYIAAFRAQFARSDVSAANLHALRKRKGWRTGRTGFFAKGVAPPNKGIKCPEGVGGRHPNARKTQFRKGNLPHNTKFLGHERVSRDGYVEISIDRVNPHTGFDRCYVLKHRWLWEEKHGPVPEGHALKCLTGDTTNCDPSNWTPVPRSILPRLNGGPHKHHVAYDDAPAELRPTILAVAILDRAAHTKATRTSSPRAKRRAVV